MFPQEKDNSDLKKVIRTEIENYNKSAAFSDRKVTDSPTDDFSVVSRKYVNMNGTTSQRPPSPIIGQQFFDKTLGYPIYWSGASWVKGDGTAA